MPRHQYLTTFQDPTQAAARNAVDFSPGTRLVVQPGKWTLVIKLVLGPLLVAGSLTFGHLFFARGDLDALRDCTRRAGAANCTGLYGTYEEIVADCEAWPPVFAEPLSAYVERLCDVVLSEEGSD